MSSSITRTIIVDNQPDGYAALCEACRGSQPLTILSSGCEAIQSTVSAPVQTWIINVTLPDMNGFELYEILRDRHPQSRFILVSDEYDANEERQTRERGAVYLSKPPQAWWLEPLRHPSKAAVY